MIYFLRAPSGGPIKIGTTIRLSHRVRQIAIEKNKELDVLAVMDGGPEEERAIHRKFDYLRIGSGEWFECEDDLLDFITHEGRPWDGVDEQPAAAIVHLKGTPEYAAWFDDIHRKTHISKATIIRLALADWAAKTGLPTPPEF